MAKKLDKRKQTAFIFFDLLKRYKKNLAFAGLASLLLSFFSVVSSLTLKYIIDEVLFSKAILTLTAIGIGMICVILLHVISGAIRNFLLGYFAFDIDSHLMITYFNHIIKLPISFFDSHKIGEIISRLDDVIKVRNALSEGILTVIMDVVMLIFITIILFTLNATLFFILICIVPLTVLLVLFFSKIFSFQYPKSMKENAEIQSFMVESFSGIAAIKSHAVEQYISEKYQKKQMNNIETNWSIFKLHSWQMISSDFINQISTLLLFWVGASLIIKDSLSLGTLFSFSILASNFTGPIKRLITLQSGVHEAASAVHRLFQILSLKTEEFSNKIKPKHINGEICFDSVYAYHNFSVLIQQGQWVAFVGPIGCGKTTLLKLLLKFYSIKNGSILLDGHDIRDIDTSWLRMQIGYVPQDISFFSGTIRDNICLYNPMIDFETIVEVSKKTGAHEFISKLSQRYSSMIGEHGITLSGGERQKIAITRALLHRPRILILDEATSNLDTISEKKIKKLILQLQANHITIISIAHRLSSIQNADRIYFMEEGRIIESGTHTELLGKHSRYKKMWNE